MGSTDAFPPESGPLLDSKIFPNFSALSRKKPQILLSSASVIMSELLESSDSDKDNVDFVNDFECTSPAHEWKKIVNIILPVNVESLRETLFTKSKFMDDFHEMKKHYDISSTEWERNDNNELQRAVKYKMPLNPTMGIGPKLAWVTQIQTESSCCIPNRLYAVDIVNSNELIPYADAFELLFHHCLTATIDNHSMYSVFGQVRYKKSVWGVVKSRIDKNCQAGIDEYYGDLQNSLQKELCTPPSKGKRTSKKMSTTLTRKDSSSLLIQPITNHPKIQTVSSKVNETLESSVLIWLIFGILVAVVSLNTVLLFKLWALEQDLSIESLQDYESLRSTPITNEDWIKYLNNQRYVHEAEILKWQKVLEVAISLVHNTENTLVELLGYIQHQDSIRNKS